MRFSALAVMAAFVLSLSTVSAQACEKDGDHAAEAESGAKKGCKKCNQKNCDHKAHAKKKDAPKPKEDSEG